MSWKRKKIYNGIEMNPFMRSSSKSLSLLRSLLSLPSVSLHLMINEYEWLNLAHLVTMQSCEYVHDTWNLCSVPCVRFIHSFKNTHTYLSMVPIFYSVIIHQFFNIIFALLQFDLNQSHVHQFLPLFLSFLLKRIYSWCFFINFTVCTLIISIRFE